MGGRGSRRACRGKDLLAGEIQASLTRRGLLTRFTKVPALKGRPTVKRRDAAAKEAFVCPTNITYRENACFMVGT
ncbi:MAG: hypothetical protein DMG05_12500 [Acidobacteria bacterium]|nr:MAG: hypothetical protein DMG05_12500 [Acidobacteriota bacterium]